MTPNRSQTCVSGHSAAQTKKFPPHFPSRLFNFVCCPAWKPKFSHERPLFVCAYHDVCDPGKKSECASYLNQHQTVAFTHSGSRRTTCVVPAKPQHHIIENRCGSRRTIAFVVLVKRNTHQHLKHSSSRSSIGPSCGSTGWRLPWFVFRELGVWLLLMPPLHTQQAIRSTLHI